MLNMSNFTRSASHQPVIHMVQGLLDCKMCILLVYGRIHKTQEITHCCYHLHSFQTLIFAWLAQAFSKIWPFSSAAPNFNQFRLPHPRESVTTCSNDTPKWVDNLDTCETSTNKWYQCLGLFRYPSYIGMSRQEQIQGLHKVEESSWVWHNKSSCYHVRSAPSPSMRSKYHLVSWEHIDAWPNLNEKGWTYCEDPGFSFVKGASNLQYRLRFEFYNVASSVKGTKELYL